MPYKVYFFLKQMALQFIFEPDCQLSRMLWALKLDMLKSSPSWADPLLPLRLHQFLFTSSLLREGVLLISGSDIHTSS